MQASIDTKSFGFREETATGQERLTLFTDQCLCNSVKAECPFFCNEKEEFLKISVTNPLAAGVLL